MELTGIGAESVALTALVAIVVGAVSCFAGYRVFRVLLALQGFVVGAMLGLALANSISLSPDQLNLVRLILALVGGILGLSLAVLLFMIAIFFSGAGFGMLIALSLTASASGEVRLLLILALAVIGGAVALLFQKLFIVLSTSFGGALLAVSGIYHLMTGDVGATDFLLDPGLLLQSGKAPSAGTSYYVLFLGWIVLGAIGALVQYRIVKGTSARG